ncbi:MmgE/PrpD family protein [Streptomyces halstedii]|uniref:MmgE/PrpD family protein n=1 Tax=Streptomyces halstedii TaxID=1944 RepID=UPI00380990B2
MANADRGEEKLVTSSAEQLAQWAHDYTPTEEDEALARRSLRDTLGVVLAARQDPLRRIADDLSDTARWATLGHVLSFDDLHMPSTTHISAVCVSAVLATGGGARAYLGAAGVMARLGTALGWSHYTSGWHATCTAGAPAAAVGAALSLGLDPRQTAEAIALAVPAAGGVQRAFGTAAKALQVGFAAEAGVRAARLVAAGADADPRALDQWLGLIGGDPSALDFSGPAVPGGLAVKIFPCCYSMQRPIGAIRQMLAEAPLESKIERIHVSTPRSTVRPLVYHRPRTGLEGKLSLEYAIAAALLDGNPGFDSFTTEAVTRLAADELVDRTTAELTEGGAGLLDGDVRVVLELSDGTSRSAVMALPPGSPTRPPTEDDLRAKLLSCGPDVLELLTDLDWSSAAVLLRSQLNTEASSEAPAGGNI